MNRTMSIHPRTAAGWINAGMATLAVLLVVVPASAARITIRSQATPQGTVVRLGDVADIGADDSRRAEALAAMPLMPAPAPGTRRYLRMREVQDLLAAHGEDLRTLRFNGQTVVEVHAPDLSAAPVAAEPPQPEPPAEPQPKPLTASEISKIHEQVRGSIVRHVQAASRENNPWQVTFQLPEQHLQLLRGVARQPLCEGGTPPWTGKQTFMIYCATAQGNVRLPIEAEVSLPKQFAVAARPIARGSIVTAADVELRYLEEEPAASTRRAPIDDLDQLIGKEASRSIQADNVIYSDEVQAPLLVRRGELITVVARGGGIRVRTQARSRENGALGDLVQLESLQTRERYDAQVIGPKEATVFAGTPMQSSPAVARRPQTTQR